MTFAVDYWELIASDMPRCFNVQPDGMYHSSSARWFTPWNVVASTFSRLVRITHSCTKRSDNQLPLLIDCSIIDLSDAALTLTIPGIIRKVCIPMTLPS